MKCPECGNTDLVEEAFVDDETGEVLLLKYCPDCDVLFDDPTARIDQIADYAQMHNGEYFNVVGAKVFLDGVLEAHTSWLTSDYLDKPGYHGLERFNDKDKMIELIAEAGKQVNPCSRSREFGIHELDIYWALWDLLRQANRQIYRARILAT